MSGYHWLASYPKSGNTWLRLALASLSRDGAPPDFTELDLSPIASDRNAFDLLLDVASSELTDDEVESLRPRVYELEMAHCTGPQIRKVHDAWTCTPSGEPLFPPSLTHAVVYIARDPRDVAVSLAHHSGRDLDQTIAFMNRTDAKLGRRGGGPQLGQRLMTWSAHVRSWLDAPVAVLLVRYEDMLAAPDVELTRVARHFGWSPADAAVVARTVEATRFASLQAAEDTHGFVETLRPAQRFFRRGVAGGWREALSPAQARRIEADHAAVMTQLGYLEP